MKWIWKTRDWSKGKMWRENIFSTVKEFSSKELVFKSHPDYKYYELAWKKVYRKWPNYKYNIDDIIPINLVVVRIVDPKIKGIEEDINTEASKNNDNTFERKLYFYTNLDVERYMNTNGFLNHLYLFFIK